MIPYCPGGPMSCQSAPGFRPWILLYPLLYQGINRA
ncbi:unnamed protein product, partial [Staurois parvus]